jgi:transmembrane sensor
MSIDDAEYRRLARYWTGECTEAEARAVEAWLASDAAQRAEVEQLKRAWDAAATSGREFDHQSAWTKLMARSTARASTVSPARGMLRATGHSWRLPAAAAAGIVVACSVLLTLALHARGRVYRTVAGQRETIMLTDGTQVTLAPDSRLTVPRAYGRATRTVALEGEAYFSVVHDARHAFAVRAARALATDVGTRFDMRAYATDGTVRVAVTEGRIALRGFGAGVAVSAGQLATVDTAGGITLPAQANVVDAVAWTEGRLVFRDTPLGDAAATLSRWYDVDIRLAAPALAGRRLTARFTDESAEDAIAAVAATLAVSAQWRGRIVILGGS